MRFPHDKEAFGRLTQGGKSSIAAGVFRRRSDSVPGRRAGEPDAFFARAKAPKEQPPRKLSGHRTARLRDTLESVSGPVPAATEGEAVHLCDGPAEALRSPDRGGSNAAVPQGAAGLPYSAGDIPE